MLGKLRRYVAKKLYTSPKTNGRNGRLSTSGVCEYALDTEVKRKVIRYLAYHMGSRRYYKEKDSGWIDIKIIGRFATLSENFPVSTDLTDYNSQEEYRNKTRPAEKSHILECIQDLVESKVIELGLQQDKTSQLKYVSDPDVDEDKVVGVRPGPRFEFAVQALMFIDQTTNSMNRWKSDTPFPKQ